MRWRSSKARFCAGVWGSAIFGGERGISVTGRVCWLMCNCSAFLSQSVTLQELSALVWTVRVLARRYKYLSLLRRS